MPAFPTGGDQLAGERRVVRDRGGSQLHRGEHPGPAPDLVDQRMFGERGERRYQVGLEIERPFTESLPFHDVQVRERGGGCRRVTGVRVAVPPDAGALGPERLGDPRRGDDRPHGQIAAGDALGTGDDVRFEPQTAAREPRPASAEPRDHLVRDEEHAGLAAHRADGRQVPVGSGVHAARTDHRLAEERRHLVLADLFDHRTEIVGVVPAHLHHILDQLAMARGVRRDPGEARARGVHPVVRAFAPDQDRPFGLSDQLPEPACHLRRRVDRVGAAARQEHAAVGDGGERAHTFRQLGRRTVREVPERGVRGERRHLGGGGIGDVAPPEPDVGEPEARCRVQVATSRLVPDVRAVPAHQDELAVSGDRRHVGERMPEVGHVAEATSGDVGAQVDGTSRARRRLSPCRTPGSGAAIAPPRRCSPRGGARSPPAGPSRSCPR